MIVLEMRRSGFTLYWESCTKLNSICYAPYYNCLKYSVARKGLILMLLKINPVFIGALPYKIKES